MLAGMNPLMHYIVCGAREGRDPHPVFDTKYYLEKNPEAVASGINPLAHYVLRGAKEGRDPHPLFDTGFYLEKNPNVAASGVSPLAHYMLHGAKEGRDPHPLFDTKFYLEQNPDVAASKINPLVHYILYGSKECRCCRPPPTEPGIKPPLLNPGREFSVSELCRRNARIASAVRALRTRNFGKHGAQNEFRLDELALLSVKLDLIGGNTNESVPGQVLGSGLRNAIAEEEPAPALEDMLLGIGVTPQKTITEADLPAYSVPILQRYDRGRLETTRRFELDPSRAGNITDGPTISILMPVYNTPAVFLERAILSVLFQTYANWELLIVDDGSTRKDVEPVIKYYAGADKRIKTDRFELNQGISAATNGALRMATGAYVGLLDCDDMLTGDALEKVSERLNDDAALDFVYSDECTIDTYDVVDWLFHKPDWSPLLLLNFMYTGHFSVYRKELVERVGGFRSEFDYSQDYDVTLRIAERTAKVSIAFIDVRFR